MNDHSPTPQAEVVVRLREALEAGPTPGEWMFQGASPFTTPDDAFAQWGEFRISANSLDIKDDDYYRIGSVSNRNGAGQNAANAAFIAAATPTPSEPSSTLLTRLPLAKPN